MRWLLVLLMGAGLGVVAGATNAGTGLDPTPTVRALGIVTSLGMVWAAVAVFSGWLLARAPWSVLAGPVALIAGTLGYYGWGAYYSDHMDLSFGDLSDRAQLLLVAGVLMGPMLGLVGGVARTGDTAGTLARALIPIGLVTEVVVRHPLHGAEYSADPLLAWTSTCVVVAGVLGATIAMVSARTSSQ
jgi:hypothetical protein